MKELAPYVIIFTVIYTSFTVWFVYFFSTLGSRHHKQYSNKLSNLAGISFSFQMTDLDKLRESQRTVVAFTCMAFLPVLLTCFATIGVCYVVVTKVYLT